MTGYGSVRIRQLLGESELPMIGVDFVVASVSAFLVVRWLLRDIGHHDFVASASYRIASGMAILTTVFSEVVRWAR